MSFKVVNFTVGDVETAAGALNVSAVAGDTNLVSGLALGGTGANRTLTITPKADQFGSTLITLTITDADTERSSHQLLADGESS
jgi:hypothetical protein